MPDRDTPIPAQSGNEKRYTVDEFLAQIEPQYRQYKDTIRKCIAGLTECAAQMAAQHQEEDLPQFRRLCIEMAEFWGLTDDDTPKGYQKMAEQYGSAFDQAVSAARESGQAPEMSEQTRQSVLDGLDLYAREMRANDKSLEDWAVECDVLAEGLERQWRTENALSKLSDMQMGECEMKQISTDELRRMEGREGLVLQGCGGDLQEWVDGINEILTAEGILKNGSRLEDVSTFQHDGLTNLLFSFEGTDLAMGRLAMWRLQTHEQFGGTWLSDYVPNRLGGFIQEQTPEKNDNDFKMEECLRGLITYAAGIAASGQDDKLSWLRQLVENIPEFWGAEDPEQYHAAFEQAVSEAHSSGQMVLSEQSKADILTGLEQYIDEMRANDVEHEPCFIECVSFMNELREQWQSAHEQEIEKPDCQLIGEDGNIFNLIGIAARTLRQSGLDTQAKEMQERIMGGECGDYSAALRVIGEYVNITGPKEYGMEMGGM